jgi:hypothetical protein
MRVPEIVAPAFDGIADLFDDAQDSWPVAMGSSIPSAPEQAM